MNKFGKSNDLFCGKIELMVVIGRSFKTNLPMHTFKQNKTRTKLKESAADVNFFLISAIS